MKIENIPADIKSKSLKEAKDEIDAILGKLENLDTLIFDNRLKTPLNLYRDFLIC